MKLNVCINIISKYIIYAFIAVIVLTIFYLIFQAAIESGNPVLYIVITLVIAGIIGYKVYNAMKRGEDDDDPTGYEARMKKANSSHTQDNTSDKTTK